MGKKKRILLRDRIITKGLQVTPNRNVSLETRLHAHLDQTRIAEGPGLDHGLGQEGLEQVHLTPGQRDTEVTVDLALKGRTIMILIGDHTGVRHAEREDVLVLARTELVIVLTPRMTIGKQGQG